MPDAHGAPSGAGVRPPGDPQQLRMSRPRGAGVARGSDPEPERCCRLLPCDPAALPPSSGVIPEPRPRVPAPCAGGRTSADSRSPWGCVPSIRGRPPSTFSSLLLPSTLLLHAAAAGVEAAEQLSLRCSSPGERELGGGGREHFVSSNRCRVRQTSAVGQLPSGRFSRPRMPREGRLHLVQPLLSLADSPMGPCAPSSLLPPTPHLPSAPPARWGPPGTLQPRVRDRWAGRWRRGRPPWRAANVGWGGAQSSLHAAGSWPCSLRRDTVSLTFPAGSKLGVSLKSIDSTVRKTWF